MSNHKNKITNINNNKIKTHKIIQKYNKHKNKNNKNKNINNKLIYHKLYYFTICTITEI